MIQQMNDLNPNISSLWPQLGQVSNGISLFGFTDPDMEDREMTFIIVEDEASYIGKQIILDRWRRNEEREIISRIPVSLSNQEEILRKLNVSTLPIVAVFDPDQENIHILKPAADSKNLKVGLERVINDYLDVNSSQSRTTLKTTEQAVSTLKQATEGDIIRRRYSVYQSDLDKTIIYSLSNEVFLRSSLTIDQSEALHQYLDILLSFYPSESYSYNLIENLYQKTNKTVVDVDTLRSIVEEYPASWDWVGCKGSSDLYGGYTCGLWTLWHVLTSSQAEQASGDPRDVLNAMTSYVREFFGCRECSKHFLKMVDDGRRIKTEVNSYDEAVLYLWDRHNEVNLRLIGSEQAEQADDPVYPKERFPSVKHCPSCFNNEKVNKEEILKFLMHLYKKTSILKSADLSITSLSNLLFKDSMVNIAMVAMALFL